MTGPWHPDIWSNMIPSVSVRMLLDDFIFKSVGWIKHIALPSMGGVIPSVKSWLEKQLTLPWVRGSFSCLTAFKMGHRLFPTCELELKHKLFLVLDPDGLWTRIMPLALLSLSLQIYLQIFGLVNFHDLMSWFLIIHLSV